jgi:hypothetical protein
MSDTLLIPEVVDNRPRKGVVVIYSFLVATLCFIAVVFGYQLFVGILSYFLGYETHFYFGRVVSQPFSDQYWSTNRVLVMYAIPPLVFLAMPILILAKLLPKKKDINLFEFYLFWLVVFMVFFVTTQMAVAPISVYYRDSQLYQGLPVLIYWFRLPMMSSLLFSVLALIINLLFGYFIYPLLLKLAHTDYCSESRPWKGKVVRLYFVFPLLLLFFVALILGYMYSLAYFIVMLLSSFLWGFGMWLKDMHMYTYEGISTNRLTLTIGYKLPILVFVLVVLIRLFLAK